MAPFLDHPVGCTFLQAHRDDGGGLHLARQRREFLRFLRKASVERSPLEDPHSGKKGCLHPTSVRALYGPRCSAVPTVVIGLFMLLDRRLGVDRSMDAVKPDQNEELCARERANERSMRMRISMHGFIVLHYTVRAHARTVLHHRVVHFLLSAFSIHLFMSKLTAQFFIETSQAAKLSFLPLALQNSETSDYQSLHFLHVQESFYASPQLSLRGKKCA